MKRFLHRLKFLFKLHRSIPFLKDFFMSGEVSLVKKLVSVALFIGYFILPTDAIPDFLVAIGLVDDVALLTFILQRMVGMAPETIKEKYRLDQGK